MVGRRYGRRCRPGGRGLFFDGTIRGYSCGTQRVGDGEDGAEVSGGVWV